MRNTLTTYLSLFTSFATLLCCALPSLLVLLGFGATVAPGQLNNLEALATKPEISHNNIFNFIFS